MCFWMTPSGRPLLVRDDHMLIEIEPALDGQRFGLGAAQINFLILSSRHRGQTLYPISEWPSFVYVARALDASVLQSLTFKGDQVELIAWGMLFRTLEEATSYAVKHEK